VQVVSSVRYAATQINDQVVGLLGIDPEAYVQTGGLTFIEGDEQAAFREMQSGRAMIINGVLATKAGIQLGDTVSLMTATGEVTYRVVGLATDYLNAKTMTGYLSQANVATDFGRSEDVFFQINLKPGADEAAVETAMNQALLEYPQFQMISGKAYLEQNENLLNSMFAGMIALVIFLAIPSLIAMINTLAIGVLERRREIGMLRAVGATRKQVNRMILAEALILSLIGTALGVASGLYLGYTSAQAFGAAGFPITYVFPGLGVALAVVSGVVIGVVAAIIPARHAARLQIVNALQYE
jgi:putative ABC transport system permease protein